jgi:hypothetical protein
VHKFGLKIVEKHVWEFAPRFRASAFGWKSDLPMQRIKEALVEIKAVAKTDPILAAEGAITLLEKISNALANVDSSSGAIGSAVNGAIEILSAIIAKAEVGSSVRQKWLERLWKAIQKDDVPYIEYLGEHWGMLCASPKVAAQWADKFQPALEKSWRKDNDDDHYFEGTYACLSALLAAERYDDLLALIDRAPYLNWSNREWGIKALLAQGKHDEALQYAENSQDRSVDETYIAKACEAILLAQNMPEEAYCRYALKANQAAAYLTRFRAIEKKYPSIPKAEILEDLVASTPGEEGKWFAAAKDAGMFDVAIALVKASPTDPRTLTRAAEAFVTKQPEFALQSGLAAMHWIAQGYGYEINSDDIMQAYDAIGKAVTTARADPLQVKLQIRQMVDGSPDNAKFLERVLGGVLGV